MQRVHQGNKIYYWNEEEIIVVYAGSRVPDERVIKGTCSCGQPAEYSVQRGWHIDNYTSFPVYTPLCKDCYSSWYEEQQS